LASSTSTGTTRSSYTPCPYDRSSTGSSDEEVITMRHTDDEIKRAAGRFEQLADELDPANTEVDHADDLRAIAAVCEAVRADEARLQEAVEVARAHNRSWNEIAVALGVSRRAAFAWADLGHTRPRYGHADRAELPWLTRQMPPVECFGVGSSPSNFRLRLPTVWRSL
jgi:hypothetical protein